MKTTQDQLAETLNTTPQSSSKRLHAMEKIQKERKWVLHELTERQMENRKTTPDILLLRYERKCFLHRIVTGDEKWMQFENPKRENSWLPPAEASTSTERPNRFGKKNNALRLVEPHRKGVPRTAEIGRNCQWRSLSTTNNQFEPYMLEKRPDRTQDTNE